MSVLLIIIGAALVTAIPRVVPLMLLSKLQLPNWFMRFLSYVPISIMAALVGQELFGMHGEASNPLLANKEELLAAVITFVAGWLTRSLLLTVIVGIAAMALVRAFL